MHRRADDAVLVLVLGSVEPPVQAGVIDAVAVPGLRDVDLPVSRPREGLERQQPESRPNSARAGQRERCDQAASRATQTLSRHEPRGRVLLRRVRVARLRYGPEDQQVVRGTKGRELEVKSCKRYSPSLAG